MITLQLDPLQEAVVQRALMLVASEAQKNIEAAAAAGRHARGSAMTREIAAGMVADIRAQHQTDEPEAPCA